jgi:hypothetical protein
MNNETQVIDPVLSSISPTPPLKSAKVVNPFLLSVDATPPLKSVTKVVDPDPSSVDPTPPLKSETKVADLVLSSVDPTPPLKSVTKVVNPVPPSIDPTPPLQSATKVVDLVPSLVDPTPHSKSEDVTQIYLVSTDSLRQGGTSLVPMAPHSSNQTISINWNHLTEPRLPSYVPFQITVQVCDRNIPNTIIDEGASISILSANAWQDFGSPQLMPMAQNLLTFDQRAREPLEILP